MMQYKKHKNNRTDLTFGKFQISRFRYKHRVFGFTICPGWSEFRILLSVGKNTFCFDRIQKEA